MAELTRKFWLANPDGIMDATPLTGSQLGEFRANSLQVAVYYTGPGEAIVISQAKSCLLVDGGSGSETDRNDDLGDQLGKKLSGMNLKAIVASHPHRDHTNFYHILAKKHTGLFSTTSRYFDNDTPPAERQLNRLKEWLGDLPFKAFGIDDDESKDNQDRVPNFAPDTDIHMLRGTTSAKKDEPKKYWSIFMFLRYKKSWFLFTGDAYKSYEDQLLPRLEEINPYAHLLKITHHGSEHGTSPNLVLGLRPKISVASTYSDGGHRLEEVVKHTLSSSKIYATYDEVKTQNGGKRINRIDIFVRTDGEIRSQGNVEGVLFEIETRKPSLLHD